MCSQSCLTAVMLIDPGITPIPGKEIKSTSPLSSCARPFHGVLLKDSLSQTCLSVFPSSLFLLCILIEVTLVSFLCCFCVCVTAISCTHCGITRGHVVEGCNIPGQDLLPHHKMAAIAHTTSPACLTTHAGVGA